MDRSYKKGRTKTLECKGFGETRMTTYFPQSSPTETDLESLTEVLRHIGVFEGCESLLTTGSDSH